MSQKKASHILLMFCGILLTIAVTANAQGNYTAALRIVVRDSMHIDSLTMNTNQDTTLRVQGRRSGDSLWESVVAKWESSPGLIPASPVPTSASAWIFSPVNPGSGWIRVTVGNDTLIRPDTVFVTISGGGGPNLVSLQIITPPEKIIAGDTSVLAVLSIYGMDGPVRGVYYDSLLLTDAIGSRPDQPQPYVIADNKAVPFGQKFPACFHDGFDTIKIVLYRAPYTDLSMGGVDTLHQLTVYWNPLIAQSAPFQVFPGALARISLVDFTLKNIDSVHLVSPTGSKVIYAVGYDAYGNYRGPELAKWSTTGSLHAISKPDSFSRIFYESANVISGEEGYIYCSPLSDSTMRDSVKIRIEGPSGVLSKNRASQAHFLRVRTPDGSALTFPLPPDVAHEKVFFALYSLSGRMICSAAVDNVSTPVYLKSPFQPGTYIARVGTKNWLVAQSRFVIVK